MNKDELEKQLKNNGWDVFIDHRPKYLFFRLKKDTTEIYFYKYLHFYAKEIEMNIKGERSITEKDFISIIEYMKEGIEKESLLIVLKTENTTDCIRETIVKYLEKNAYERVDLSKNRRKEIITKAVVYATNESITEIDYYNDYYLALRDVLSENYHTKMLFDYDRNTGGIENGIRFFVNVHFHRCGMLLKRKNDTLELSILDKMYEETIEKWGITKKEEIKTFIQPYIDKMEQKQRVKVLFESPPDYFFDIYCTLNEIGIFEFEYKRRIHDALLNQYSALEIEYLCAKYCKDSKRKTKIYKNSTYFYFFDEKTIVVNKEKTVKIVENEQKVN